MNHPCCRPFGLRGVISVALLSASSFVFAQETSVDEEEAIELSPFVVDETSDLGYAANNTLAGTRLNSSLRDTAASISVMTPEFIEDTGFDNIEELIAYSANTVVDTGDAGAGGFFNTFTNAANVTQAVRTRGIAASRSVDYFKAIIPNDSYRVGRYDDARGPNGVLFGVSSAGGLINQSSYQASLNRNSGRFKYGFGINGRSRGEFRFNQVVVPDRWAVAFAGMQQINGHWRDFATDEKDRIYATTTINFTDRIRFRANFENGFDHVTTVQPTAPIDEGLPFLDNMLALGVDAVTFEPTGGNPNNAMRALGVTRRDGNPQIRNGFYRPNSQMRWTYAVNDGVFYNATGSFITDGYNDTRVRHPDGTPGIGGDRIRINDPGFMAPERYLPGPDHFRETDFEMLSAFLDIELPNEWFLNVQFATQEADVETYSLAGPRPELFGDPNTTRGMPVLGFGVNPYAGRMHLDGEWRNDTSLNEFEEIRASLSHRFETKNKWLGSHQIAVSAARTEERQTRHQKEHVLGGNPDGAGTFIDRQGNRYTGSDYGNIDNRIQVRNYIDLKDTSTWRAGGWSELPATLTTDRWTRGTMTSYPTVFAYSTPGNLNYMADTTTESALAVTQSYFWDDRFVVTLGYRQDDVNITRYGHQRDDILGWIPNDSITEDSASTNDIIPASPEVDFSGTVRTTGLVFHATNNFSLVANESSNVGVPDFRRTVFPDGLNAAPSDGTGVDFGVAFNFLENRINGRFVYYETESEGQASGGRDGTGQMEAIYDLYETFLTGTALEDLLARRTELRPEVNGKISDNRSTGLELRLTANITRNWRLSLNAAKTDRKVANLYRKSQAHLGLIRGADGLVQQGATFAAEIPDPNDPGSTIEAYTIDSSAYTSDGVMAAFLGYESQLPAGFNMQNTGISFEVFDLVEDMNDRIIQDEKRWGLRPYRFNIFTAYDFKEGLLKDWSIGGGYRWQDANIIGEAPDGSEVQGKARVETDMFIRYRTKKFAFSDRGRWTFQMNVYNIFDNRDVIPGNLGGDEYSFQTIPGDRGVAYQRFDNVPPREYRFSVTYDF